MTVNDVIKLSKGGLGDDLIIQQIVSKGKRFDLSTDQLLQLKAAHVSDRVIQVMIDPTKQIASPGKSTVPPAPPKPTQPTAETNWEESPNTDAHKLVEKALNAIGPMDKLTSITAVRMLMTSTQSHSGSTKTFQVERTASYPDRLYIELHNGTEPATAIVITPQSVYSQIAGQSKGTPSAGVVEDYRTGLKFDSPYIAQHISEFTSSYEGRDMVGEQQCDKVRISHNSGKAETWCIDSDGRVLRKSGMSSFGEYSTEFSDFRSVDGVNLPFHRHSTNGDGTTDTTVASYQLNPPRYEMSAALFDPPPSQPTSAASFTQPTSTGLRIRVLEEKSVPYVQRLGGGPSTSCYISGNRLNCDSYDTTINWPHVLNVMLVEASDGNAYLIACDRAWAWSKCVPLRVGETFDARQTTKGMAVRGVNAKGKESEPTYAILQSKVLK